MERPNGKPVANEEEANASGSAEAGASVRPKP